MKSLLPLVPLFTALWGCATSDMPAGVEESLQRLEEGREAARRRMHPEAIGHFTAANFDAVDYLKKHHADVVTLHVKDRKKDQGANVPFGQGDTPIKEVLRLLRDNRWAIPAMIEYEYKGADAVEEVRKSFEFMKQALA